MATAPGTLFFLCNICGSECAVDLDGLTRETPSCASCRSSPRARAVIDLISRHFFAKSIPLPEFPTRLDLRGLGLSDSENYASRLARKFRYQNTFFHQAPLLDISAEPSPQEVGSFDFVIASEIFEHVRPPVARAFENAHLLLKPGGLFVLTVPYGMGPDTIEHFPQLDDFTITKTDGHPTLINRTSSGVIERFEHLVFHGGAGATLEMRVFSERAILRHLAAAGFSEVKLHRESNFRHGVWWPQPWSRPISALKTLANPTTPPSGA